MSTMPDDSSSTPSELLGTIALAKVALTLGAIQGGQDRVRGARREQVETVRGRYQGALAAAH